MTILLDLSSIYKNYVDYIISYSSCFITTSSHNANILGNYLIIYKHIISKIWIKYIIAEKESLTKLCEEICIYIYKTKKKKEGRRK